MTFPVFASGITIEHNTVSDNLWGKASLENEFKAIGGTDFITDPAPVGMGMRFYGDGRGHVRGEIAIHTSKQGPPGYTHGGALIALLDEAMGAAAWNQGYRVVAVNLQFNLWLAVPLQTLVTVMGEVMRVEGRKVFCAGRILLPDETIAVAAEGLFVMAPNGLDLGQDVNPFAPLTE